MTKEEKQLLLKDLCARLPYGVMVGYSTKDNPNTLDKTGEIIYVDIRFGMIQMQVESGVSYGLSPSEFIKPYLRPMSSVTEDESSFVYNGHIQFWAREDYCNKHHLDYRGLIEKGLALEAPKDMYKF